MDKYDKTEKRLTDTEIKLGVTLGEGWGREKYVKEVKGFQLLGME